MVTVHHPVVVHHHQEKPKKMLRKKKSGARTSRGQLMCLSDRISDNIQNPTQKQASQKEGLGLKKIVFDLEDTKEEVCGKLTSSELDEDQYTIGFFQLKNCDGFELLRYVSNCRVLESIECTVAIKTLKTSIGQGII